MDALVPMVACTQLCTSTNCDRESHSWGASGHAGHVCTRCHTSAVPPPPLAPTHAANSETGTLHNRLAFVGAARRALRHLPSVPLPQCSSTTNGGGGGSAGGGEEACCGSANGGARLTAGDFHSLLQMLCPDWPPGPVRKAWSAAVALQEGALNCWALPLEALGQPRRLLVCCAAAPCAAAPMTQADNARCHITTNLRPSQMQRQTQRRTPSGA